MTQHINIDGAQLSDNSILIQVRGWVRFKILSWLLKDANKFKIERVKDNE